MKERHGPCEQKKCSWCCDPVKVPHDFPQEKVPLRKDGISLWTKREEVLIPADRADTDRLQTYDCKNYDKKSGQCLDYANRPDICRNTSCIDKDSTEGEDVQFDRVVQQEFIVQQRKR